MVAGFPWLKIYNAREVSRLQMALGDIKVSPEEIVLY
jgi:hypothetical protein